MAIIQLPVGVFTREAAFRQCDEAVKILREYVPNREYGMQFYMGDVELSGESLDLLREVIDYAIKKKGIAASSLTVHHPFALRQQSVHYHFAYPQAVARLRKTAELVKEKGIPRMTIHFSTFYHHPDSPDFIDERFRWQERWNDRQLMLKEVAHPAYNHLMEVAVDFPEIHFGVENMPIAINGGLSTDPVRVLYDPLMHSVGRPLSAVEEFLTFVHRVPNIGVCFDTAHFLLAKGAVDALREQKAFSLPGIYFPRADSGSLLEAVDQLLERKKLIDVQVSDITKIWIPHTQLLDEGTPLLSGLGGRQLIDVVKRVLSLPGVGLSLDMSPQKENYTAKEWEQHYVWKKEQIEALKLLKKEGVL